MQRTDRLLRTAQVALVRAARPSHHAFEWSAQYKDYYDSTEEDPETHTSVWQWLDSAMELVVGDSHESAEDEEKPAAASTGPSAGQGKRRRR